MPEDDAETENVQKGIKWLNIIRFHKDVLEKAEENVFALPIWSQDNERWTCLDGDPIKSLTGEWSIPNEAVRSEPFLNALQGNPVQSMYIGGACYVVSRQDRQDNAWRPYAWVPLIYKEVDIERQEQFLRVIPKETGWNISPQVLKSCGNAHDDAPDILLKAVASLNDTIKEIGEGVPLREGILKILFENTEQVFPVGHAVQARDIPRDQQNPTSWVLFCPPQNAGGYTRHLMRDYKRLEQALIGEAASPGGIAILEGPHPPNKMPDAATLRSPIPLTDSQRRTVAAIVGTENPLTVVSGPPGTGKSQVVAAVLADCWRSGRSVLFTSTNNKAVNVVKERVDDLFNFPMVIRTGNPGFNNQSGVDTVEKLSGMIHELALLNNSEPIDAAANQQEFDRLQGERLAQVELMASELPQRILEERQLAREAFGKYRSIMQAIKGKMDGFSEKLAPFVPEEMTAETMAAVLDNHVAWLKAYDRKCQPECKRVTAEKEQTEQMIDACYERIASASESIGSHTEVKTEEPILLTTAVDDLREWKVGVLEHVKEYDQLMAAKPEWVAEYEAYRDASQARAKGEALSLAAEKIRSSHDRQQAELEQTSKTKSNLSAAEKELETLGISPGDFDGACFTRWREQYVQFRQTPLSFADKVLFQLPILQTNRQRTIKKLLDLEARMLNQLPTKVWPPALKKLEDIFNRDSLMPIVDAVLTYEKCKSDFNRLAESREAIRRRHREVCECALALDRDAAAQQDAPIDCEKYLQWAKRADELVAEARRAAVAWENRDSIGQSIERLRADYETWRGIRNSNAVLDGEAIPPAVIGSLLKAFLYDDEADRSETIRGMNRFLHELEPWEQLRTALQQMLILYDDIQRHTETLQSLPTLRSIREGWFESLTEGTRPLWEELNLDADIDTAALMKQIERYRPVVEAFQAFCTQERPAKENEAAGYRDEAFCRLNELIGKIPNQELRQQVQDLITHEMEQGDDPGNRLDQLLSALDPQTIVNKIREYDSRIVKAWLELAKSEWHQRSRELNTGESLTSLRDTFAQVRGGVLPDAQYDVFRRSLSSASCWVATSLSSMSVPMQPELFDIVMIDEASQCTVTNVLPFAYRARRLVIIGDNMQLQPVYNITGFQEAELAENHELSDHEAQRFAHQGTHDWSVYSAGEAALPGGGTTVQMLLEHFRCHPSIISFSNRHIYQKALRLRKYPSTVQLPCAPGVNVVDVPDGSARHGDLGKSWINENEAQVVCQTVRQLLNEIGNRATIGVITTFAGQKKRLQAMLRAEINEHDVMVDTAHGFQGDERDIVIYSPVVAPQMPQGTLAWVGRDPNLINVAVTRAREAFFFVGNLDFCSSLEGYLGMLARYCREIKTMLDGGSPVEVELYGWMMMRDWGHEVKVQHHIPGADIRVDFYISKNGQQLAIEVDGRDAHQGRQGTDEERDQVLKGNGIAILRFTPLQISKMPFNVVKKIEDAFGCK
jgi:very-short-patch-repair endonuclease